MHRCFSARPRPELRQYVRAFAQREISSSTPDVVQPVLASLDLILELDFANSPTVEYLSGVSESSPAISMVGPHTHRRAQIRLRGPVDSLGVFFRPLALSQLFNIPAGLLVNRAYNAQEILGNDILWLRQWMGGASFEERVLVMEDYLLGRAAKVCASTNIVSSALHILELQGSSSVTQLAKHAAFSVRQFERRFLDEIGMPPKLFARIARYQSALDAKVASPARSWLHIAHQFGYHDQMHMVRDFYSLNGYSPGGIFLRIGDMRPAALDACSEH